ncbi:UvrD-helicase domain-containing protein [Acetivibrio straminisolvens]|jgi:superfamily I DNA/RNA helicase|uniref:UvrD-helicase domain-containing protein n=1 Tax=Acetivibrio straminisolvens TaxID=253314 RepID=UPI00223F340F|nr:ATP-dependent helicase [Acetivibrio straminisolvens]
MIKPSPEQEYIINYFIQNNPRNRVLLVEAPPGTGKTFTAVTTAMYYTHFNIENNPRYNKKVLILTFSKNARAQIEKQLDILSSHDDNWDKYIEITNFHSFFQKYVWAYSRYLGLKENLIIMSSKQRREKLKNKLSFISDYDGDNNEQYEWAEALLEGDFRPLTNKGNVKPAVKKLIPYKEDIMNVIKEINKEGYIGFSDIAYYMWELLQKSQALLNIIQNKYNLIILDEYQDSSDLQDKIVKKLIGKSNKAIFFADSKQMIYSWRGASSERLNNLLNDYKGEIEKKELIEVMRFKNRKDIENILKEAREGNYNINNFNSSENIEYVKVKVKDKNIYSREIKNHMFATLKYKVFNKLPKYNETKNKSIGILCRSNEQVSFLKKALREEFNINSQTISNNEDEHDIICDLIEFMRKQQTEINEDELCREILKYIFFVIYDNNIGSIKRNKLDDVSFNSLKRARLEILKTISHYVEEANEEKDYYKCLSNSIKLISNNNLQINYDMMSLVKKVLHFCSYSEDRIMDIFLQYQYLKAFKELIGIYVLNVHQSKGREFDYVFLIDRETINKEDNLLYVALSRVKEKLVVFDWVV